MERETKVKVVGLMLLVNAGLGVLWLEWAWYRTRRYRKPIAELNAQFPELCRYDAPGWRKWKLYPGAMTFLIPRFLFIIGTMTTTALLLKIWLIGHKGTRPMSRIRKFLCTATVHTCAKLMGIFGWWTDFSYNYLTPEEVNHYEEYLGPLEEQKRYQTDEAPRHPNVPKRGRGPSSTLICNHVGFTECLNQVCTPLHPSFTPNAGIKNVPVASVIAESIQSLYMDRAGSVEAKNQLVQRIVDRQEDIEVGCKNYPPLSIFAEGTTTNGTRIIPFKRGAFQGMRTVTPSFC